MKTTLCFTLTLLTFVTLAFVPSSFAQDDSPEYIVRVIYFLPKDQQPLPNIDKKLDELIKHVQKLFADNMEVDGFGRKTFRIETDKNGKVIVHHVKGQYNEAYYHSDPHGEAWNETAFQFDEFELSKNIYFCIVDVRSNPFGEPCGIGVGTSDSGIASILTNTECLTSRGSFINPDNLGIIVHELLHAFGWLHNDGALYDNWNSLVSDWNIPRWQSEWQDVHRYFNPNQEPSNDNTEVQMLPPTFAEPPATIRLQFEITDPDGLHQTQLYKPFGGYPSVIAVQRLSGKSTTVEFLSTQLIGGDSISLRVIDAQGNFGGHRFPLDLTDVLPPAEEVSIPDPNLAAAIRNGINLESELLPGEAITQYNILKLRIIRGSNRKIKDLTGLEHALNLFALYVDGNQIRDLSPLSGLSRLRHLYLTNNPISDITPITGLTHLQNLVLTSTPMVDFTPFTTMNSLVTLILANNQLNDISFLAGLTNLRFLNLVGNQISDVTPLAGLTNLSGLYLRDNQISDVSSLTGLINLKELYLHGNPIKNRKPLFELLEKNPDVKIYLKNNREPLPVNLSHFRAERTDAGVILKWTTESEIDNAGFYIY